MRCRRVAFRWLLLLLLALPGSCGQGPATLSASQATLAGSGALASTLDGIVVEQDACDGAYGLSLSASQGVLTVDEESTPVWVNPTVAANRTNTQRLEPLSSSLADGFSLRE